ncbi:hypothetical protein BN159_2435 [Streptomyces davaonensis JCM 4913]|uniref:Uncharacterized protein n=1 Tax=Streptomyces davaonensis (strain DSM 101723 / JCM 4913 / KCC S-0913 / 768) TaxID=1214101 RepID=K4R2E4_STRDJ|nr:DUF6153 family protein [Streptomyces davaonensis]CCK26814.1 hypothetical protein BN159_2435 [Streptomyces davaonensis JCM 4913]
MRASRYVRAGGALGQLLLVVVLALGVFVMHTVGHPEDSAHEGMRSTSHAAPPMEHPATDEPAGSSTHEPAMPMDMASLCVAVLFGAWVLAALLKSAFTRHGEWLARLLAQVAAVLRPNPPPRGPDLTQLSVLRQ